MTSVDGSSPLAIRQKGQFLAIVLEAGVTL